MGIADDRRRVEEARRKGIPEWMQEMIEVVPDHREIAAEFAKGVSEPSSLSKAEPQVRGSGWAKDTPLKQPPGIDIVDQLCEAQADRDRADLAASIKRSEDHRLLKDIELIEKGEDGVRVTYRGSGEKKFVGGEKGFELWRKWNDR